MSDDPGPIPGRPLPTSARAPGKCVLFGEHAVVHGAPELVLAVDLDTQVVLAASAVPSAEGDPEGIGRNPYLQAALAAGPAGRPAVNVHTVSRVPRSAGLGSSAAFVSAVSAGLGAVDGGVSRAELAQRAFSAERTAQGVGSPGDTSASVAGGYVALNAVAQAGPTLWEVTAGAERWEVRRAVDPGWVWVVAFSGIPRSTAEAVKAVSVRLDRPDGPALLASFAEVARAGIAAVADGDRKEVGRLLLRNQELLREVDVSHPRLEELLAAAAPAAEGAKLTGAGRGGSIVALPQPGRELELVRRLARAGAVPYAVRAARGASLVERVAPARP